MTTAPDRELTPISTQAHQHMKRIVSALKKQGLYETNTGWLTKLILSQPMPNGNGHASTALSVSVKPAPVEDKWQAIHDAARRADEQDKESEQ